MTATLETKPPAKPLTERPLLQLNRLNYVRINAKILDATEEKLKEYLKFATGQMDTKITNDDVMEYALNLLFDRDPAFKSWLKHKT